MFDDISLRRHLQYDIAHDVVIVFEDDGTRRTKAVGSTALVILPSGIVKNWVQPVAFAISKRQTNSSATRALLIGDSCKKQVLLSKLLSAIKGQTMSAWLAC